MIVHVSALMSAAPRLTDATVQDTAGKVAYVPKAGGPPDSSGYMWAGYAITAVAYGGYIVLLLRRMARAKHGR
ncbi:hypothetical protein [Gemmatimonas sp.]|uniref:hypothetical protein n=1 Tax=Gemmatimonas sp. TaxID=1962908 RepID=UPI00286DD2AB|nr:hypothetical protein [Gemmatimonas sp.]